MKLREMRRLANDENIIYAWGSDYQWWKTYGGCGGCGTPDCHEGIPCSKGEQGCRYCPGRVGSAAAVENVERWWRREDQKNGRPLPGQEPLW